MFPSSSRITTARTLGEIRGARRGQSTSTVSGSSGSTRWNTASSAEMIICSTRSIFSSTSKKVERSTDCWLISANWVADCSAK